MEHPLASILPFSPAKVTSFGAATQRRRLEILGDVESRQLLIDPTEPGDWFCSCFPEVDIPKDKLCPNCQNPDLDPSS